MPGIHSFIGLTFGSGSQHFVDAKIVFLVEALVGCWWQAGSLQKKHPCVGRPCKLCQTTMELEKEPLIHRLLSSLKFEGLLLRFHDSLGECTYFFVPTTVLFKGPLLRFHDSWAGSIHLLS